MSQYSEGPLPTGKESVRGSKRRVRKNQVNSGPQQDYDNEETGVGFIYPIQKEMRPKDVGLKTKELNMSSFSPKMIEPNQITKGKNVPSKGKATHNASKSAAGINRINSQLPSSSSNELARKGDQVKPSSMF